MKSDIEIARSVKEMPIIEVARKLNLKKKDITFYGSNKAKINNIEYIDNDSKLILVTAINPTPFGEGKTTVSIGLGDALTKLNKDTLIVLREPSLGPVFGIKGGATGGGYSQVIPMDEINLHFTGDFHAITSANNLLCAAIDNHIYNGNDLNIDPNKILFNRCIDMNDRSLREIKIGSGRTESFNITAASEIMAIFCLATDLNDLKIKLENIIIGFTSDNKPIKAKDLNVVGSMLVLLKDAIKPNLVQTLENNPVIIHGGPFANIAHGCNSIIATKTALSLSEYVVTEAGFGADLGAEKFFNIKCRNAKIKPDCVVLVATIKAIKHNGLNNLSVHIDNLKKYNVNIVVCLNKYIDDKDEDIDIVANLVNDHGVDFVISESYLKGSNGATKLAEKVIKEANKENEFKYLYDLDLSIKDKIKTICNEIYRIDDIKYSDKAIEDIKLINKINKSNLPICIAKTQYITDKKTIFIKEVKLNNGAGFITIILGNIMTMPGLSKNPAYEKINLDDKGNTTGLF